MSPARQPEVETEWLVRAGGTSVGRPVEVGGRPRGLSEPRGVPRVVAAGASLREGRHYLELPVDSHRGGRGYRAEDHEQGEDRCGEQGGESTGHEAHLIWPAPCGGVLCRPL